MNSKPTRSLSQRRALEHRATYFQSFHSQVALGGQNSKPYSSKLLEKGILADWSSRSGRCWEEAAQFSVLAPENIVTSHPSSPKGKGARLLTLPEWHVSGLRQGGFTILSCMPWGGGLLNTAMSRATLSVLLQGHEDARAGAAAHPRTPCITLAKRPSLPSRTQGFTVPTSVVSSAAMPTDAPLPTPTAPRAEESAEAAWSGVVVRGCWCPQQETPPHHLPGLSSGGSRARRCCGKDASTCSRVPPPPKTVLYQREGGELLA